MGSLSAHTLSPKDKNRILFESLPASLPEVLVPDDTDHLAVASAGVARLERLEEESLGDVVVWRDLCALTGTFRTFYGPERVLSVWRELYETHRPRAFKPVPGTSEIVRFGKRCSWVQMAYTFECCATPETLCSGIVALVPDANSQWRIWMFTTLLEQLKGYPSPDRRADEQSHVQSIASLPQANGMDRGEVLECVVAGAGFSGLATAGRLKALGINVVTLDKNPEVGDNWKNRYDSARCEFL